MDLDKRAKKVLGKHYGNFQQYLQEIGINDIYHFKESLKQVKHPETPLGHLTKILRKKIEVEPEKSHELAGRLFLEICCD